jgi:parallel beta-helix repeat protein
MNKHKLFINKRLVAFLPLFALGLFAACSKDEGVAPEKNHPPQVEFTVAALAVPRSSDVTLTVNVTDPDDDPVSVHWEVTRGTFTSAQGGPSIRWATPGTVGRDTLTITATDDNGGTTTLTETIRVGTLKTLRVTVPQTWNTSDSPFIIRPTEDSFVIAETQLTLGPGCELLIDREDLSINVSGSLVANGTAQAPVLIAPNRRTADPGFWAGITANPSGDPPHIIQLTHTKMFYASQAVFTTGTAEAALDGCTIMFSSDAAVAHGSSGDLTVENSIITNNAKSGIRVVRLVGLDVPASVAILNDSIAVNGDVSGATPYVDQAAIFINMSDSFATSDIRIENSEISRNAFPGIQLAKASYPEIHYNTIFSNELGKTSQHYNIRLDDGFGGTPTTIDARNNFWGSAFADADSAAIRETIRDSEDVGNITVRVAIYPWLNAKP